MALAPPVGCTRPPGHTQLVKLLKKSFRFFFFKVYLYPIPGWCVRVVRYLVSVDGKGDTFAHPKGRMEKEGGARARPL